MPSLFNFRRKPKPSAYPPPLYPPWTGGLPPSQLPPGKWVFVPDGMPISGALSMPQPVPFFQPGSHPVPGLPVFPPGPSRSANLGPSFPGVMPGSRSSTPEPVLPPVIPPDIVIPPVFSPHRFRDSEETPFIPPYIPLISDSESSDSDESIRSSQSRRYRPNPPPKRVQDLKPPPPSKLDPNKSGSSPSLQRLEKQPATVVHVAPSSSSESESTDSDEPGYTRKGKMSQSNQRARRVLSPEAPLRSTLNANNTSSSRPPKQASTPSAMPALTSKLSPSSAPSSQRWVPSQPATAPALPPSTLRRPSTSQRRLPSTQRTSRVPTTSRTLPPHPLQPLPGNNQKPQEPRTRRAGSSRPIQEEQPPDDCETPPLADMPSPLAISLLTMTPRTSLHSSSRPDSKGHRHSTTSAPPMSLLMSSPPGMDSPGMDKESLYRGYEES